MAVFDRMQEAIEEVVKQSQDPRLEDKEVFATVVGTLLADVEDWDIGYFGLFGDEKWALITVSKDVEPLATLLEGFVRKSVIGARNKALYSGLAIGDVVDVLLGRIVNFNAWYWAFAEEANLQAYVDENSAYNAIYNQSEYGQGDNGIGVF